MSVHTIDGVIPPVPTPFDDQGRVAHDELAENLKKLCATGIAGVLVLGSNGEYVYLSEDEKRAVVKTAAAAVPAGKMLMVGTGCESTAETVRLTRDCAELGAHTALVVTPCYYGGGMTPAALQAHFSVVADQSPIPVLLYNVPKFTHVNIAVDTVAALSAHPNIIGIKDSTGNVTQLGDILHHSKGGFQVLVGSAGAFMAARLLGCPGGVLALANVAPEECVRMHRCVAQGDLTTAREIQLRMIPVNTAVTATFGIAGLKAAMQMRGYYGGPPRPPLLPLDDTVTGKLRTILITAGLLE